MPAPSRSRWAHLHGGFVDARVVAACNATGSVDLATLAREESWSPAPLEMVSFSLSNNVRQAAQITLAQYSSRFHDVRLVAGMAGFADIANSEYVCDSVHNNLGRINNAWYEKYGLSVLDSGACRHFLGKGEPLQIDHAISFFGWENRNYAHWLSEKLGRFYWINQAAIPDQVVVLVEAGLPASIMESLAIFWPKERIVCVQPGQACDVGVLYHFSDTADIWEPRDGYIFLGDEYHLYPAAIAWMTCCVKTFYDAADDGHQRIYLIRPPGGNGRTIVNQQTLLHELQVDGFLGYQPETQSFGDQVRCLSSCELAVLGSGAAAANLLWMPVGATVVILIQDNPQMWYWFFHALAVSVGIRLVYFPAIGQRGTHEVVFHQNVDIPIAEFYSWLKLDESHRRLCRQGVAEGIQVDDATSFFDELALQRRGRSARIWSGQDINLVGGAVSEALIDQVDVVDSAHKGEALLCNAIGDVRADIPLVSVCIAAYNHEAYIAECLDSVLAQTYGNIEILVVDDASSDNTPRIVEAYVKKYAGRIRAILLDENEGPALASNRVFYEARGDFVALLGSDDRMLPPRIEQQVRYMQQNPRCVGVFSDIDAIDATGLRSAQLINIEMLFNQPIVHLRRQLLTGNFLNAPSVLIRRADLLAVGGYTPILRYVQDYDLWGRLLARGELVKLSERLTEYRVHGANLSIFGKVGPVFAARCETAQTIVRFVNMWSLDDLLDRPLNSNVERAEALLELAAVLELVDRHYFRKPMLACAQAYELILQASQLAPQVSQLAKSRIELCLDQGFVEQLPLERGSNWFDEPYTLLSRGMAPVAKQEERPGNRVQEWVEQRDVTPLQKKLIDERFSLHRGGPHIGVVILDVQGDTQRLMATVNSLQPHQGGYAHLTVVALTPGLMDLDPLEEQLQVVKISADNYVATLNELIRASDFDWLMLVRSGEEFTANGLIAVALQLLDVSVCRAVYGDELQRMPDGSSGAMLRPAFNLDLLLSFPAAMSRHWLFHRQSFLGVGGFDPDFVDAMEFDLLLRLIEQGGMSGLGHVDEPLLLAAPAELVDLPSERTALLRHLQRRGYELASLRPYLPGRYRIEYGHARQPLVSIIIPTKDQLPILQRCVESLLELTNYPHYEVLIVDNGSETAAAREWLDGVAAMGDDKVRILRYPHPFNYSAINNLAAREARGEYLVLLNNDTAIISGSWLDELLNHAQRPEVGIVGAKLLYPDGRIQHAGVVLGLRGPAEHPFIGDPLDSPGYMHRLQVDQNYSAVTAACLMIRKSIYDEVGGLDEEAFKVSYNDVDLCLKVGQQGYLIVWTPHAVVMHEGSVSQKKVDPGTQQAKRKRFLAEQDAMYAKWLPELANDPAYNANLALNGPGFTLENNVGLTWRPLVWRPQPVVLAHNADPWGCGNYRIIKPHKALREAGLIDGAVADRLLELAELQRLAPDVVVYQRQTKPESLENMARARRFSSSFKVYELDDYLPNTPIKSAHRSSLAKDVVKLLRKGLGYVDRFVVSTPALANALSDFHADIRVVENRLSLDWWGQLDIVRNQSVKPRVGWAGGVGHQGDLELIADVVRDLADEVEWVFFGMCPDKLKPYISEFYPGVDIALYPEKLASLRLDLALAPLEDNLFNACKSNLRLIEYGICGFPVIASDIECYRGNLPVTLVKNRYRDWMEAIRAQLEDREALRVSADKLREVVQRDWMLDGANLELWRSAWVPS